MEYRDFGQRSGLKVPRCNIGGMRLPADEDEAIALIRHAIDSGMRYIDTCRMYSDSEIKIGKALKDGYREKVILSSKWSIWMHKLDESDDETMDTTLKRIEDSMKRLDVDQLDYYQVWNIHAREQWETATKKGGPVDGIRKAIDMGLVRRTGFTTHDSVENLLDYIPAADWADIILVSYNMLNRSYEPVIEKAREYGIGTLVMNPVAGGKLAENSPVMLNIAKDVGLESVPEMAIRWIMSNPAVDTILSGINKISDVDDSIRATDAGALSEDTVKLINERIAALSPENVHFCTGCRYCLPCPQQIDIPNVMSLVYNARFLGLTSFAKTRYSRLDPGADACAECGACMEKCTQGINIIEEMKYAASELAG